MGGNSSTGRSSRKTKAQLSEENDSLRCRIDELEAALPRAEGAARPPVDGDARLRDILEACPIGIAILDEEDGRRLFVNSTLVDILGAGSREQLLQGNIATTWVDQSRLAEAWSAFQKNKNLLNFEAERIRLDESRWWVLMNTQPITFDGAAAGIVWHIDITPRKQAEEALRDSEERFRDFAELGADWFWEMDENLRYTYMSKMLSRFGVEPDSLIGKTVEEIRPDNYDLDDLNEELLALKAKKPYRGIERPSTVSPEHWISVSGKPLYDEDGTFLGYHGVTTDITERKKAEAALNESEARLRAIIDNYPSWITLKDLDGRFLLVNEGYAKSRNTSIEDAIGKTAGDFETPDHVATVGEHDRETFERGEPVTYERDWFGFDQEGLLRTVTKFPAYGTDGQLMGIGTISIDISDRKKAEEALQESEEKYRLLTESTGVITWEAAAATFQFTYVAPQAESLLGYPVEDWYQDDFWPAHIHPDDKEATLATCLKATERGEDNDFEYRMIAADGRTVWLRDIVNFIPRDKGSDMLRGVMIDITERKRVEGQSQRLLAAISAIDEMFVLWGPDDKLVVCNERFRQINARVIETTEPGTHFADHIRTALEHGLYPQAEGREEEWYRERIQRHRNPQNPFELSRQDGVWLLIDEQKLPDGSTVTISLDITQRKNAELAVQESEGLLDSIIENVPVGLLVKDADHIVERANSTYLNWYGFDADTMVGRKSDEIEDFQPAEEAAFMNAQELEVLTTGQTQTRQVERPFADGQVHTVSITKFPVYDQQGNIIKVGSASVDLTEQVDARNALAHSQMRFRNFAESASDRFWETDEQHRFTYVSDPGGENLMPRGDEILGKTRWSIAGVIPEAQEYWRDHLADLDAHRSFRNFVFPVRRPDGRIMHFSVSGNPIFDGDRIFKGYRGTARDITAEVEAVRTIESAKDEADKANRAKTEFLANLSHELRTPLAAITGFSELLANEMFGPIGNPRYQQYAKDIFASGMHLVALINDILDASLIETGKVTINDEIVDVRELVGDCKRMSAEQATRNDITLSSSVADNVGRVRADSIRLTQILLNLLTNAIKFTPVKGKVKLRVEADAENGVCFVVDDTGIGISRADISRVVEPFVQVGNIEVRGPEGTGLGLTIAKSLAELHGGDLTIESELGVGTTITVRLPSERNIEISGAAYPSA